MAHAQEKADWTAKTEGQHRLIAQLEQGLHEVSVVAWQQRVSEREQFVYVYVCVCVCVCMHPYSLANLH